MFLAPPLVLGFLSEYAINGRILSRANVILLKSYPWLYTDFLISLQTHRVLALALKLVTVGDFILSLLGIS